MTITSRPGGVRGCFGKLRSRAFFRLFFGTFKKRILSWRKFGEILRKFRKNIGFLMIFLSMTPEKIVSRPLPGVADMRKWLFSIDRHPNQKCTRQILLKLLQQIFWLIFRKIRWKIDFLNFFIFIFEIFPKTFFRRECHFRAQRIPSYPKHPRTPPNSSYSWSYRNLSAKFC